MNRTRKLLLTLRAIVLIGLISGAYYCLWKNILPPPLDMNWSTELCSLGGIGFIYCFIHINSSLKSFLYKLKAIMFLPLISGLFFHWMTHPELKKMPLCLCGILLSIIVAILSLMDAIWMAKEKCYMIVSILAAVLSCALIIVGTISAFFQIILLGLIFTIVCLSDLVVKEATKRGGVNYEKKNTDSCI